MEIHVSLCDLKSDQNRFGSKRKTVQSLVENVDKAACMKTLSRRLEKEIQGQPEGVC